VGASTRFKAVSQAARPATARRNGATLSHLAAAVGAAGDGGGFRTGVGHGQVEPVACADPIDEFQCLGEVRLGVEEDHLDAGVDGHRQIDEDDVLERAGEHQVGRESLVRPGDDRAGGAVSSERLASSSSERRLSEGRRCWYLP